VPTAHDQIESGGLSRVGGVACHVAAKDTHIEGWQWTRGTPYLYVVEKSAARVEKARRTWLEMSAIQGLDEIRALPPPPPPPRALCSRRRWRGRGDCG